MRHSSLCRTILRCAYLLYRFGLKSRRPAQQYYERTPGAASLCRYLGGFVDL